MKIVVNEIPDEGPLHIEMSEERESILSFLGGRDLDFPRFGTPVTGSFCLSKSGKTVFIDLKFECSLILVCSRCLVEFPFPLRGESRIVLSPEVEARGGEKEEDGNAVRDYYVGDVVDLGKVLAEETSLVMPYNPLCRKGCKGLCNSCGKNLNEGECECNLDKMDDRFSVLKDFKLN